MSAKKERLSSRTSSKMQTLDVPEEARSSSRAKSAKKDGLSFGALVGAASIAASVGAQDKKKGVVIWPEWSDGDINAEKWDVAHKGKEKDKGKSPVVQHFFEDPDGKIELPPTFKVACWKRPQDYITDKTPVIFEPDSHNGFDLMTANEHVHESELMRWITSQIVALWNQSAVKPPGEGGVASAPDPNSADGDFSHSWRPWEHIYAINKIPAKAPNIPAYNPHGKYVVKLYWMGSWRKLVVDDMMPFDEKDRLLLPATTLQQEVWPMLLAKALIKVASIEYIGGSTSCEFGDFSVIHCLTGWLPECIPLQYGHLHEIWLLLKASLPEFKLPEPPVETPAEGEQTATDPNAQEAQKDDSAVKEKEKSAVEKDPKSSREGKDKEKGKEKGKDDKKDKKDKDKEKDKDKMKEKSLLQEDQPLPEHPEVVVFAAYSGPPKYPVRISALKEMADASEKLRQSGISHMYPHPVLLTQTRSCPLEPPPPPEKVPSWKLIRPKKKKQTPSDEPIEEEKEKIIQSLEITSPFINYKVSSIPIPTDTHRPKSSLERGAARVSSRPGTANVDAIEETDESAPDPEPQPPQILKVEQPHKTDEPKSEEVQEDKKPASAGKRGKKTSAAKKDGTKEADNAPPASPKPGRPSSKNSKRQHSAQGGRKASEPKSATDSQTKDNKTEAAKGGAPHVSAGTSTVGPSADTPLDPNATLPGEPGEQGEEPEAEALPQEQVELETKAQDIWMDFEDFCKCFKMLYIYHKPHTYACTYKHLDIKTAQPAGGKGDRKSAPNTAAGSSDDKSPCYLFVDNLKPTEIVVSFSALSRWNDPPPPPAKEESKTNMKAGKGEKGDKSSDRDSKAEQLTAESCSVIEGVGSEERAVEPLQPGLLVAEPYSWKSLVTGQPVLRTRTTATRAAVLSLAEGRHVLRFNMSAPLGYMVHLVSSTKFVFGDEEKVMAELTQESCRFVDNATQVMLSLGKCINNYHDLELFEKCWEEFQDYHCPYRRDKRAPKQQHYKIFHEALYNCLKKIMNEANLANADMAYAWRCLLYDATTKNPLGLPYGSSSRPATGITTSDRGSAGGKKGGKKRDVQDNKVEYWKSREITPDEHVAAVKLQKQWRGFYVRKVKNSRAPGTEENVRVQEVLQKAWSVIEPNAEQHGLTLFRNLFKVDPDMMQKYPFYKDEWNKISYADYQGNHPDQPPNTWFIVFRDIFYVAEEMLCVPKMYVPIPTCMLRVINNDTGEEIPRVFQKVAPVVYKKNKRGYTFVAEARTTDHPLMTGRWRMRLIGSLNPLPAPPKTEVNGSFHTRELRDYYLPNEKNVIHRFAVKVQDDHLVSLQLTTSRSSVYVKLSVLDGETELMSAVGKGHVVLPAFIFQKDVDSEPKRSSSRSSNKGGKGSSEKVAKGKRAGSASHEGRLSRSSSRRSINSLDEEESKDTKPHKYIIEAVVLRNSWPLSEMQWKFVQQLKQQEKEELKVANKERPASAPKSEKMQSAASTKGKEKGGKGKGKDKGGDKGSRPPSQQFDFTKPNFTLRIVSDAHSADEIEVKKDTERADEIRAMKKAWEDAEPGRAAKALQSRLQYLNSHMIKVAPEEQEQPKPAEGGEEGSVTARDDGASSPQPGGLDPFDSETNLSTEPPPPPTPKEVLQPLDLTPFIYKTTDTPRLLDEAEQKRQLEARQAEIAAYRAYREQVEARREMDRQDRNLAKVKQLELFEEMQFKLDNARETVNAPREAYRQKFLEAERKRLEEIANQEAAMQAELAKSAPSPKGRKSAKGKKSPSGKKKK